VRSGKRPRSPPGKRFVFRIEVAVAVCLIVVPATARAGQEAPGRQDVELILAVSVNGRASPLLWQVTLLPDGSLAMTAERLRLLGFDLRRLGIRPGDMLVRLSDLPGVRFRYTEATQSLAFEAADAALIPVVLDDSSPPTPINPDTVETSTGALLNYGLFVDASRAGVRASAQYDLRFISPYGVGQTTGFANWRPRSQGGFDHVRLDTQWRYVDVRRVLSMTLGDTIADGGRLATAYRFAGVQIRRNYNERADLVATALPILTASAAVPSSVDLYLNGLRYFSGQVGRGPFEFRSLPNLGGGATATIVLTDPSGRETRITKPIFFIPNLFPKGRLGFSFEAGFPRRNYGLRSFDYYPDFAASGTIAYGVSNRLTLVGHAETTRDLWNASVGGTTRLGDWGSLTAGIALSRFLGRTGIRRRFDVQARVAGVNLFAGVEDTSNRYQDIASATLTRDILGDRSPDLIPISDPTLPPLISFSRRVERVGANFSIRRTGVNLNYARARLGEDAFRIASVSLFRPLFDRSSAWLNSYKDFGKRGDWGIFGGITISFGRNVSASASVSRTQRGATLQTRAWRTPGLERGSVGWTVVSNQPLSGSGDAYRAANVSYLARFASLEGGIEQYGNEVHATAYAEGSIVAMNGLYAAPRIDTSFAVVNGAGPDTPVLSNTRPVTRTNKRGKALVTDLTSLQSNTVSIDPTNLPVDVRPARTEAVVVPAQLGGVVIDFGVRPENSAVVTLVDATGNVLPVGSTVRLRGTQETAVVGYDGRVYLTGLGRTNQVEVLLEGGGTCSARFDYQRAEGRQVQIGPVRCE
jgi:outer membrane usher protein